MVTRSLTVRSKLALLFLIACTLTFGVGGSFISRSVADTLEEEILARLESESWAYATALDGQLTMLAGRTADFASDGFVRDAAERLLAFRREHSAAQPAQEQAALSSALRDHFLHNKLPLVPAFVDLQLVTPDGEWLLSASGSSAESTRAWIPGEAGAGEPLVSGMIWPEKGEAFLAVAAPLVSRSGGRSLGWLVACVQPQVWVESALAIVGQRESSWGQGKMLLLDSRGSSLSLGLGESEEREGVSADAELGSDFRMQRPSGARSQDRMSKPLRAEGILVRSYALGGGPWLVRVESKPEQELAAVAGLMGRIFGLGILVAVAACALFLFPMGILTRPLLRLAEAAKRVGDGQDPELALIDSNDEIGAVGRSFVAMAAAVKERTRLQERSAADLLKRQAELQSERDRLKAVIGSMGGGLIVLDPDGKPVVSNSAAEPILRVIQNKALDFGPHHSCDRTEVDSEACRACLFETTQAPKACQVEAEGRTYEVHASELPPDAEGRVGRVIVCMDFTDRVDLDERLIHQERLAVLGEVAAVMAHELNNPLAAISMYNQMLARELEGQPDLLQDTEVIQRNVASCKRAIRELLDYATGATPELGSIDIAAVLEDVAAFTRPLRERGAVKLEIRVPEGAILAWGDELQVRQIFVNLVVNAIQVLAPGGGHVRIEAHAEANRAVVDIEDDGPGVSPAAQADIFRPFFTTKARGEGTGLGLPTARRIAEMHGGGVDLVRTGPDGSVFRVRLMQHESSKV